MNTNQTESLRKAVRIGYKMARRFLAEARKATSQGVRDQMIQMAAASRANARRDRARLAVAA